VPTPIPIYEVIETITGAFEQYIPQPEYYFAPAYDEYTPQFSQSPRVVERNVLIWADSRTRAHRKGDREKRRLNTIPANSEQVQIPYTQSGGDVRLIISHDIIHELIDTADRGAEDFDLTHVQIANSFTVPVDLIAHKAEAGFTKQTHFPVGIVHFDADATKSIAAQTGNRSITLTFMIANLANLRMAQVDALMEGDVVYELRLTSGHRRRIMDIPGETIITVPSRVDAGIWYIDNRGTLTEKNSIFDSDTNTVTFTTDHMSMFILRPIDEQ
jgi:hypothetical protein